ncbi:MULTISPECIES: protein-methionine-sulfoxide reductase heme-binding subunit MsrQ [Burkholderia]|uniref:protein-methionine-sulfoxide reductase heme-binding subunit MsrQ n=1 Tax=Burkholderia TaxID=32008 RepID=UPI00158A94B2|nr:MULTISPECIES: protein-methionine-sulfoxide reductase heme-binding subunit MsrQ [unclassified Burkholderia]CAG2259778.1 sulfite oxidase [Burkholderia cenocepacia]QRR12212.1 protein-methionine-sulfoxide reductase heme-binding subunit MsrQ [Burkholderia sp. MS389]QVN12335.1 protein-methionine-sulfoxide reductase heme-binding subunit MsrQ [Burkholderia sp. LAS2]CAG2259911.1 sulfite oxidase [Burkholderia cenocepacia]CAG2259949.1 sulfite oxidase [Burkholderia cenocepacia]
MRPSTLTSERAAGVRSAARTARTGAIRPAAPRWLAPAKVLAFAAGLYPLARVVLFGLTDRLGANPIEFITRSTGLWTLVLLCITLAVTPLRRITGFASLLRFRRMIGLFAFFYATLHFTTYLWFDKWFDVVAILKDVGKRPFITVGFAAFVLLIPLAATSPRAMVRRLGRHWATLHSAIYAIALFGVLHFWWMRAGKHDLAQPKLYAAIVAALLGWRVVAWGWRRVRA